MDYKPIREYVFKVAQDKKQELWNTLRDKLIEELKRCEPTREDIDAEAEDLYTVFSIWSPTFAKIDALVEEYAISVARQGDSREKALETIKRILEL